MLNLWTKTVACLTSLLASILYVLTFNQSTTSNDFIIGGREKMVGVQKQKEEFSEKENPLGIKPIGKC